MDIRDYADKVWLGAVEDSIAHAGMGGSSPTVSTPGSGSGRPTR
jgi:hypothetical protein